MDNCINCKHAIEFISDTGNGILFQCTQCGTFYLIDNIGHIQCVGRC